MRRTSHGSGSGSFVTASFSIPIRTRGFVHAHNAHRRLVQAAQLIATSLARGLKVSPDQILQAPYLLIGSIDQICEDLQVHRERYGISYISVFEQSLETLAPVVARLVGQ